MHNLGTRPGSDSQNEIDTIRCIMGNGRFWPKSATQEVELSWIFALLVLSVAFLIVIFAYNRFCTKYESEEPTWFQKGLPGFVRSSSESAEFDDIADIVFEDNNLQENKSENKIPENLPYYPAANLRYGIGMFRFSLSLLLC